MAAPLFIPVLPYRIPAHPQCSLACRLTKGLFSQYSWEMACLSSSWECAGQALRMSVAAFSIGGVERRRRVLLGVMHRGSWPFGVRNSLGRLVLLEGLYWPGLVRRAPPHSSKNWDAAVFWAAASIQRAKLLFLPVMESWIAAAAEEWGLDLYRQ